VQIRNNQQKIANKPKIMVIGTSRLFIVAKRGLGEEDRVHGKRHFLEITHLAVSRPSQRVAASLSYER
jgi:hypothetical protein